jgi:subtilase family serine protease
LRGAYDALLKEAISVGINVDFSTGDFGDNVILLGYADVAYPASSPYATSIGGTSLALTSAQTMNFQTGWGNNITKLIDGATKAPLDPPTVEGFIFGATGGNSNVYSKPAWQVGTNQPTRRATPDVSWLADPYTGVEIVQTISGTPYIEVIGGTSVACPMFSAIWAIANQKANTTVGLGDAASQLYNLPSGAILDVVPYSTANNVHGVITDSFGTFAENANELAAPLDYTRYFYSALYQGSSSKSWYALTFGTDSTLFTQRGWDNVTGVGTPNGLKFVTDIANKK